MYLEEQLKNSVNIFDDTSKENCNNFSNNINLDTNSNSTNSTSNKTHINYEKYTHLFPLGNKYQNEILFSDNNLLHNDLLSSSLKFNSKIKHVCKKRNFNESMKYSDTPPVEKETLVKKIYKYD